MKEYDLNVCAWQIIKVKAETEEEAVEHAFYEVFGEPRSHFATTTHEVVGIKEAD